MNFKNFALIGHPVGHTMSPFIHSRFFALCGENARYGVLDIPPEELASSGTRLRELNGFNITIPHKRAVIPFLDACSPKATEFGSVNTVKNESGRLVGYTTDGTGFRLALEAAGTRLAGKVTVLGAGGAARAIAFEAVHAGAEVTVAAREHSFSAAERLCADLRAAVPGSHVFADRIAGLRGKRDLLVNATPAGMYPNADACAASEDLVAGSACVFDAVYNPGQTKLLALAKQCGKKAVGGIGMLVGQAAAAQEIWFGVHFSDEVLRRLCEEASFEMKKKFGSVVLCGFMGSGKTTCGKLLAQKLNRPFLDLDEWIERKAGMTVSEIFAQKGEAAFRKMERMAVEELSLTGGLVIAAGGGALLQKENAAALRANDVVILLDASLETVKYRLKDDHSRPLLHQPDSGDVLAGLYAARREAYRAAADTVLNADGSPEETAEAARKLLQGTF